MREVHLGGGVVLKIPEGWDAFLFRGVLYVKDDGDHFTIAPQQPVATGAR